MKVFLICMIIFVLVGTAGFLLRSYQENSQVAANAPASEVSPVTATTTQACPADAKVCPDGSAVGRTGPNCSFAACPFPNIQLMVGSTTLAFVLPAGYQKASSSDPTVIASYAEAASGDATNTNEIVIHDYQVPTGETPGQVMLNSTIFDPSELQATSTNGFANDTLGNNTFSSIQIGDFEGLVQTAYYLQIPNSILRFDVIEQGVSNWADPNLDSSGLPQHQALTQMLATLQVGS